MPSLRARSDWDGAAFGGPGFMIALQAEATASNGETIMAGTQAQQIEIETAAETAAEPMCFAQTEDED